MLFEVCFFSNLGAEAGSARRASGAAAVAAASAREGGGGRAESSVGGGRRGTDSAARNDGGIESAVETGGGGISKGTDGIEAASGRGAGAPDEAERVVPLVEGVVSAAGVRSAEGASEEAAAAAAEEEEGVVEGAGDSWEVGE